MLKWLHFSLLPFSWYLMISCILTSMKNKSAKMTGKLNFLDLELGTIGAFLGT